MASAIANLLVRIGIDGSAVAAGFEETNRALREAHRQAESTVDGFNRLGQTLSGIGGRLSVALTAPLAGFGTLAVKAAADMDSLRRGMIAVSGSADAAAKNMERLKEVAKLPGLGFREAVQGSVNLQAAGFSAQLAERSLKAFGNALATVGKGRAELDGVITALSQIATKGKVSAEEINQLAERVPQIRKIMQTAFGTADTEVLKKAGLDAQKFIDVIVREFERLPQVTGGIKNSFENLSDATDQALAKIGEAVLKAFPNLEQNIESAGTKLVQMADWFGQLPGPVKTATVALAGFAALGGPVLFAAGQVIQGITGIITAGRAIAALNLVGTLSNVSFALSNGLVGALSVGEKAMLGFAAAATAVVGAFIGWNIGKWIRDITGLGAAVDSAWKSMDPFLQKIGLTTQVLDAETRAATDNEFATRKLAEAKQRAAARMAEAGGAGLDLANKIKVLTKGHQELTAEVEKTGGRIRRTAEELISAGEAARKYAEAVQRVKAAQGADLFGAGEGSPSQAPREAAEAAEKAAREFEDWIDLTRIMNEEMKNAGKIGQEQFPKVEKAAKRVGDSTSSAMKEVHREVKRAFDGMARGMADSIVKWEGFGNTLKSIAQNFASGILEIFIQRLLDPLQKKLADVLGGVLGGSTKPGIINNAVSGGSSIGGGAASSSGGAASGAASSVMSIANLATGIVGAVSGVIGNFQMSGMNKTLDLIERELRIVRSLVESNTEQFNRYLPNLEHIHGAIWGPILTSLTGMMTSLEAIAAGTGRGPSGEQKIYLMVDGKVLAEAIARAGKLNSPAFA